MLTHVRREHQKGRDLLEDLRVNEGIILETDLNET